MSLSKGEILGGGEVRDEDGRVLGRRATPQLLIENTASFTNNTEKTLRVVSAFVEIVTAAGATACSHLRVLSGGSHLFVDNTAVQAASTKGEHMWSVGVVYPVEHKETGNEPVFVGAVPPDLFVPPGGTVDLQIKAAGGEAKGEGYTLVLEELP